MPWKKSPAAMVRSPSSVATVNDAPRATSTVGRSDAGSAWATLPPMVPRLRTAGSPMTPAAAARAGACFATSADAAISAWVVRAPMRTRPSATAMPFSSATRPMSISADGTASRSFSRGIRLCPPARSLAPGCARSSRPISATESAR